MNKLAIPKTKISSQQHKRSNSYQVYTQRVPKNFEEFQKSKNQIGTSTLFINNNQHNSVNFEYPQEEIFNPSDQKNEAIQKRIQKQNQMISQNFQENQYSNDKSINPLTRKVSTSIINSNNKFNSVDHDASISRLNAASQSVIGFENQRSTSQKKMENYSFRDTSQSEFKRLNRNVSPSNKQEEIVMKKLKKKQDEERIQVVQETMLNELKIQYENQQFLEEQKIKHSQNYQNTDIIQKNARREAQQIKNQLERKVSALESDIQKTTQNLLSKIQSPFNRTQNTFLSNRTSPSGRGDQRYVIKDYRQESEDNTQQFEEYEQKRYNNQQERGDNKQFRENNMLISGDNEQDTSPYSRIRIAAQKQNKQIKKQEFYQKTSYVVRKDTSQCTYSNIASYSSLEKTKIISSLLQENSINNLQYQMMKLAQNQNEQIKQFQPSIDIISQINNQKNSGDSNRWRFTKKSQIDTSLTAKIHNNTKIIQKIRIGQNNDCNTTNLVAPDSKDSLFKSLLRKNSINLQQNPQLYLNQIQNSQSILQKNTERELQNKENQQQKSRDSSLTNTKLLNPSSHNNNKIKINGNHVQIQIQNQNQLSDKIIQIQPNHIFENRQLNIERKLQSSSQPKQKFPQYFQINLSEYIKSQSKNSEKQSILSTNQVFNDRTSLLQNQNLKNNCNIYDDLEIINNNKQQNSIIPQFQQFGISNISQNTNNLDYGQFDYKIQEIL